MAIHRLPKTMALRMVFYGVEGLLKGDVHEEVAYDERPGVCTPLDLLTLLSSRAPEAQHQRDQDGKEQHHKGEPLVDPWHYLPGPSRPRGFSSD